MKKEYSKPQILFEGFTMSTNIAGDCEKKTNTPSLDVCGLEAPGLGTVFMTGMNGCSWQVTTEVYNGICYHGPVDNSLFNS